MYKNEGDKGDNNLGGNGSCSCGHGHYTKRKIVVLVGVLLAIFLATKSLEVIRDLGKTDLNSPTISITGEGKVFVKPDIGKINLAVMTESATVEKAQTDATERINKIFESLKKNRVEEKDIKTTNYSIYPQYDYNEGKSRLRGYQVSQNLDVKIRDLAKIGSIITDASTAGANQVGNLEFTTEDPMATQAQARTKAIEDAKKKAEELASKLGVRLGKVVGFSESGAMPPPIFYGYGMGGDVATKAAPPAVPTGENEVVVNVNVIYQIK